MSIDIQINIECGQCFLRSNQPTPSGAGLRGLLTKKPSARDLKAKMGGLMGPNPQSVTKLSIPSLDARMFYTSNDAVTTPPLQIRQLFQARDKAKAAGATCLKNKCFYFSLELASMPLETLITPCLADFLEQVVEPLPESLFETAKSDSETSSNTNSLPIVAIDTSSLPLDVLFHMSVQSSSIRFEGQQQRSSAADMLLTLPRLTLMASTRKYNEQDWTVAGIYLSATLSSFSLSIYSPHQQSSSHDALSLTLDKFSVTASRTKNPNNNEDDKNKVQLVIASNVGTANFNYDMRRLSELLTFPKPWYRKQLIRRLFFGEQSVAAAAASAKLQRYNSTSSTAAPAFKGNSQMRYGSDDLSSSNQEFQPKKGATPVKSVTSAAQLNQITWAASVIFSMQWKELNINAQMSNTMGNTQWLARQGILRVHLKLDSQRHRDVAVSFKLLSSELSAQGGAISGEVSISKLLISARHSKSSEKAPENVANLEFENIECRTEWMSRPIFIGKFAHPQMMITDEWKHIYDTDTAEVSEAMCFVNISGSWTDLQMVITKNTVGDMIKIGDKLIIFFKVLCFKRLQSALSILGMGVAREGGL
uniref:Bridge-like lipid transfer protein family member 1 C-terminal domain-containing protein n=1 Tax=Ditylenchus dipsaci TaxID=166011 RepID=A0A915E6Q2_9BILA